MRAAWGVQPGEWPTLHALFQEPGDRPESEFVDAVTNNLRRGRIVVLVVGDGIRKETERPVEGLQSHAGFHFTFALVELGVYRVPGGDGLLVVPNALAQTQLIDRGVVRLEASGVRVDSCLHRPHHEDPGREAASRRKTSSTRCRSCIRIFRLA